MASTSSTSMVVATNRDARPKPKLSTLQTPVSASYPSEIRSPLPGTSAYIKKEENIKTPITPPNAYLDFLKNMSPGLMSPAPTGTNSHFSFSGMPMDKRYQDGKEQEEEVEESTPVLPTSQPPLSRTSSSDSTATVMTVSTEGSDASDQFSGSSDRKKPKRESSAESSIDKPKKSAKAPDALDLSKEAPQGIKPARDSPRITIPQSAFVNPTSARLTRRAQFLGSPLSPIVARTPMSARSHYEPRSASCLSATPWSASFPPTEPEGNNKTSRVYVRQVVTRTVTYSQTPLDPAPKGKRRKLEE
ncbi:hypothetical protein BDV97DRAFT_366270 [Delphinella strobiligena]|nr:hypothetical protein BDV97DRAFT_366270 [Delphinella strobiligena]